MDEQLLHHVILRRIEAPLVNELTDDEHQDSAQATHVGNKIKQGVTASRHDSQVQIALKSDVELRAISFLVAFHWQWLDIENCLINTQGRIGEIEKQVLQIELSLLHFERSSDWVVRVDSYPVATALLLDSLFVVAIRDEPWLVLQDIKELVSEEFCDILLGRTTLSLASLQLDVKLSSCFWVIVAWDFEFFLIDAKELFPPMINVSLSRLMQFEELCIRAVFFFKVELFAGTIVRLDRFALCKRGSIFSVAPRERIYYKLTILWL